MTTVCIPVTDDGAIDPRWGKARRVAVVQADLETIRDWHEYEVSWDALHDTGTEGAHHARIARFIREHHVETVVAGHMGPGMQRMLHTMGVTVHLGASGPAQQGAAAAAGLARDESAHRRTGTD